MEFMEVPPEILRLFSSPARAAEIITMLEQDTAWHMARIQAFFPLLVRDIVERFPTLERRDHFATAMVITQVMLSVLSELRTRIETESDCGGH